MSYSQSVPFRIAHFLAARIAQFVAAPFARVIKYRGILLRTAWVEIVSAYAGSLLGLAWLVLGEFLLLSVYIMTYVVIFKFQPEAMTVPQYVLYVFAGIVPFIAFASSLTSGANSVSKDKQLLLNTVFPSELVPVRAVLISSASLPVGLAIVIGGDFIWGHPSFTIFLVPVVIVLQLMFMCGVAWILALVTLILRDIQYVLQYVVMMLMLITPIAFTPAMAPPYLKSVMYGNPLFYYVYANQTLIVHNELPSFTIIAIMTLMSVATFVFGFWLFERAKLTVFDYI